MTPDGHRPGYDAAQVAACIELDPELAPRIILVVSPCRAGSTVLLRVFSAIGLESHFQPMKNVLRWSLLGEDRRWAMPSGAGSCLMLKETLGPFTAAECSFNPLQVLVEAGFPGEKLHVLILGRDPLRTWASWYRFWPERAPVANMIQSFCTTRQIQEQTKALGIGSTCLVFDVFRDHSAETVVRRLCERLDLGYSPLAIQGWDSLPGFGEPGSNIVLPQEPEQFVTPRIHDRVKHATHFAYGHDEPALAAVRPSDSEAIAGSGLAAIYAAWCDECGEDLQLAQH